jgi:hypothetical protein
MEKHKIFYIVSSYESNMRIIQKVTSGKLLKTNQKKIIIYKIYMHN